MKDPRPTSSGDTRVLLGVAAVAFFAILGSYDSYQLSVTTAQRFPDPYHVALSERRFVAIAEKLPATGLVGYLSDMPCEGCAADPTTPPDQPRRQGGEMKLGTALRNAGNTAFVGARYALAPRVVAPTPEVPSAEWAVGNFSRPLDFAAFGSQLGFTMVADLGNGVVLYRRAKP
jgi:hypothetical protein